MGTSLRKVEQLLDAVDLSYNRFSETEIVMGFTNLRSYRDLNGEPHLAVSIELLKEGLHLGVSAPVAYDVPDHRVALFKQACVDAQSLATLFRFQFQPDGTAGVGLVLPLEEAPLTQGQLSTCLFGLVRFVDRFHPVFEKVLSEGVIDVERAQ